MTRKKRNILIITGAVIFALALGAVALWHHYSMMGLGYSEGRLLITEDGTRMLVHDGGPTRLTDVSRGGDLFDGLRTGDKIRVLHDMILTTYPGSTGAYKCQKLESGTVDDIPKDVIEELTKLGWISAIENVQHTYEPCEFEVQRIRSGAGGPDVRVINSLDELRDYTEAHFAPLDEGEAPRAGSFREAAAKYDEEYFRDRVLVFVTLLEGSGSIGHHVTSVRYSDNGKLSIAVDRLVPECGTDDMAGWHIIVEPEAGATVKYDSDVSLFIDGVSELVGTRTITNGYTVNFNTVANISVDVPEGWTVDRSDYRTADDGGELSISFRPADVTEGWITLKYIEGAFEPEELEYVKTKSDTYGTTYHYTDDSYVMWDHITFTDELPGTYAVINDGADSWWNEYAIDAEAIVATAKYAEGLNRKSDIIDVAIKKCDVDYVSYTVDYREGRWYVDFYTADYCVPAQTVWINSTSLSGFDGRFYF